MFFVVSVCFRCFCCFCLLPINEVDALCNACCPATLSAVFGVNLVHGLENKPGPLPFLGMVAAGLFSGIILTFFLQQPDVSRE